MSLVKSLTLSYKVIWWLNLDIVALKCGSNVWDNNQLTLYFCDCVAECPHEYKKHRPRTGILWCYREQWFLRSKIVFFLLCIFLQVLIFQMKVGGVCVCVCAGVCVCTRERDYCKIWGFCLFLTFLIFNFPLISMRPLNW